MGSRAEQAGRLESGLGLTHASAVMMLAGVSAGDRSQVGGKAVELGRLARAGLPVPPGAVIPVRAFQAALQEAGLWDLAVSVTQDPAGAPSLKDALRQLTLPEAVRERWVSVAADLGSRVAVRSSAIDEDGAERSFAGQHTTVLEVRPDDVPQAVLQCWAGLYSRRAMAYRGAEGPPPGAMGVVLQRMVEPSCSGVLFTVNPLSGSWREMVVEAVWGLGEGLVSGQIAPHWYLLRRPRSWPRPFRRVAERVRLQVVEEDLPELPERIVGGPGGATVREPTPASLRAKRTLERPALRRLGRLGLKVERALGGPQDIEWVRDRDGGFQVLQARPITASNPPRPSDEVLWTRRFIGERWPEPATPLGWSLFEPLIAWFIAYPETQARYLGGGPSLKLVHGRPYVNATVFRHLAFKLPGAPAPRFMLELVPPEEEEAWRRRFAVAPDLAVYGSILRHTLQERRWRRFRWNPWTNPTDWEAFRERLEAELPVLRACPPDPAGVVRLVDTQIEWVREYVGIHICSLLFANLFWQLLESTLTAWFPDRRGLMDVLATSPRGNHTVLTHQAIYELALEATGRDLDALAAGRPLAGPFKDALRTFLERYGHRAEASWELMSQRWGRCPETLAPLLRAQRDVSVRAPEERAKLQEERFERTLGQVQEALSGPRWRVLERLIHDTRRYLLLRENQRFWFDHLLDAMQGAVLCLGEELVSREVIAAPADIALLTWSEVRDVVAGRRDGTALASTVERRRAVREADQAVEPPTFLLGDATGPADLSHAGRLQGMGISAGRVRGPVRVLRSAAEAGRLKPGDILVSRSVDPGWTPLFLTAGAVVLELGSMLSHGAVIAREYEVPAVVNIDDAMRRLKEGQEVTVDGNRGVVWIHDPEG